MNYQTKLVNNHFSISKSCLSSSFSNEREPGESHMIAIGIEGKGETEE